MIPAAVLLAIAQVLASPVHKCAPAPQPTVIVTSAAQAYATYAPTASTSAAQSQSTAKPKVKNKVTILHTNDVHSHLDQFGPYGTACREKDILANKCYGGVARIKSAVDSFRANNEDVLLFDAGDQFQGTLFFNVFGGKASVEAMNTIKYDGMAIGNHEFDDGLQELKDFIEKANFPVMSSNIKGSDIDVKPYIVFPKYNLGVIGFITADAPMIIAKGAIGNLKFSNPIEPVQNAIDELNAQGIKRIICVSHNGYKSDMDVASKTRGISLIVGGHSHDLLSNNASLAAAGPYPTKIKNLDGKFTHIVQAHRFGDYLGHVELEWNEANDLVSIAGEPILLDQTLPQDEALKTQVAEWAKEFSQFDKDILTKATDAFPQNCSPTSACAIGILFSECMISERIAQGFSTDLALINSGGIRAGLDAGDVSATEIMTALPFINSVVELKISGQEILSLLERVQARKTPAGKDMPAGASIQTGGLKYTVDFAKEAMKRVSDVFIQEKPIDLEKIYTMATVDFLLSGGDGIFEPRPSDAGVLMSDSVISCLRKVPSITPINDGRVTYLNAPETNK